MQSADAACRSFQFENPSKTFLSLPVSRERRNALVEGSWGEPRGWPVLPYLNTGAEFSVAIQRYAPQESLDFGLPGWANICVSRRRDFAAKSRAASSEISRNRIDIRVRRVTCQDCKSGVTPRETDRYFMVVSWLHRTYLIGFTWRHRWEKDHLYVLRSIFVVVYENLIYICRADCNWYQENCRKTELCL